MVDLFVLFRRLILACFVAANNNSWQGVGISVALLVNIALVLWLQPAITTADNIAEVVAVSGLLLTHMDLLAGGDMAFCTWALIKFEFKKKIKEKKFKIFTTKLSFYLVM